jgi:hypothetical protein
VNRRYVAHEILRVIEEPLPQTQTPSPLSPPPAGG